MYCPPKTVARNPYLLCLVGLNSQVGALVEDPKEDQMNSKVFLDAPVHTSRIASKY